MRDTVNPLVSLIIPIFNVEKYIADCIDSVLKQTYRNIEIILVDDGSPDRSADIAKGILEKSGRDYILLRQENKGQGEARNSGFKAANGEWVYFLDSDDMIVSETIEHLVKAIDSDNIDFVFSDYRVITDKSEACNKFKSVVPVCYDAETIGRDFLLRRKIILAPGTLYRKSFLENNNLRFEQIPWSEDQHFVFRLLRVAKKIGYVKEPLYQYLQSEGSIMHATEPQKVVEGYVAIESVAMSFENDKLFGKFITARWVMGTLNSTARMYDYDKWRTLYKNLGGKKHLKTLLKFPDIKVKMLSFLGIISSGLYYKASRRFCKRKLHNN